MLSDEEAGAKSAHEFSSMLYGESNDGKRSDASSSSDSDPQSDGDK